MNLVFIELSAFRFRLPKDGGFHRSGVLRSSWSTVSETMTWCKFKKLLMHSKIETTQLDSSFDIFSLFPSVV
jgi:hypothetical protein